MLTADKMCTMLMRADKIVWANSVRKSIDTGKMITEEMCLADRVADIKDTRRLTADNLCGLTD